MKNFARNFVLSLCLLLNLQHAALAQETIPSADSRLSSVYRHLFVNRLLRCELSYEAQQIYYDQLKDPSAEKSNTLKRLNDRIDRLEAHRRQLLSTLPASARAAHFLRDEICMSKKDKIYLYNKRKRSTTFSPVLWAGELHEKGLKLVEEKNYDQAIKVYEDIIFANPNDDQAFVILGHLNVLTGHYSKAEEYFVSAIHIYPENTQEILPFYQNQVLSSPSDDMAYTRLGYVYMMLGQNLQSRQSFESALSINPMNRQAAAGLEHIKRS